MSIYSSIRVHVRTSALFTRCVEDGQQRITAHFTSPPQVVNASTSLDVDAILNSLNDQIDYFNERGSGWILERVTRFELVITEYRPLCGCSSYIKTPKRIADKRAVVNVQNDMPGQQGQMCFIWAILSCLRDEEVPVNKDQLCYYKGHKKSLSVEGITFPVQLNQIPYFENQNPDISINVITIDGYDDFEGKYSFCIDYESPHRNRTHKVNLLLLEDEDDPTKNTLYVDKKIFAAHRGQDKARRKVIRLQSLPARI